MTEMQTVESLIRAAHRAARADRYYTRGLTGYADLFDRMASALQATLPTTSNGKSADMISMKCNYCGWTVESSSAVTVVEADMVHRKECIADIAEDADA